MLIWRSIFREARSIVFNTIMDYLPLRGLLDFLERVGLMMERAIVWA